MIKLTQENFILKKPDHILCDADGTAVFDGTHSFSSKLREAVISSSIPFSLNTGREFHETKELISQLPRQIHFVAGGSTIVYPNGKTLILSKLSSEQIEILCGILAKHDPEEIKFMRNGRWSFELGTKNEPIPVVSFNFGYDKIKAHNVKDEIINLKIEVSAVVTTDGKEFFVHVSPKGFDKANAVKYLINHKKIQRSNITSFGDQTNDIPLFVASGTALMVEDGAPELKEYAHGIIPSVQNDGVALALTHLASLK